MNTIMASEKGGLKRKTLKESKLDEKQEEPASKKPCNISIDEDGSQSKLRKLTSQGISNYSRFRPPSPFSIRSSPPTPTIAPSPNRNLTRSTCFSNNDMSPLIFLDIHHQYERMLQQVPSSKMLTVEKLRNLLPFSNFFEGAIPIIKISRECNGQKLKSPTLIPSRSSHGPMTFVPSQNINSTELSDDLNPLVFLEIHNQYEKMLQLVPGRKILTAERLRDIIPFTDYFDNIMLIIKCSREHNYEYTSCQ
ncbi:uncharacterized protein [Chelonus insularis]|uniref:uncharacterized protein n=1 Tax=Chelonus insularis TaxID=460826 RepID=UPI00158D62F2|nr:uncharacterized protein LOC118065347 [Chelonus insularis]KAG8148378.1 CinsV6_orph1 protein [Chelonus insularis]